MGKDYDLYRKYCRPAILGKDIHFLEGLMKGIAGDGVINQEEDQALKAWCLEHAEAAHITPFNELIPIIHEATKDGIIADDEREDILWCCKSISTLNRKYDSKTADLQRLHGLLAGVVADRIIFKDELETIQQWLGEHEELKGCWPYDEVESLLTEVMRDGVIDAEEQRLLLKFLGEFSTYAANIALGLVADESPTRAGVCASCPEVEFIGKAFCFTGTPQRGTKEELGGIVIELGGSVSKSVRRDTGYLVVGACGNECWAFSCYGRKVEKAVKLRKSGIPINIVHEFDFWDAVQDARSA